MDVKNQIKQTQVLLLLQSRNIVNICILSSLFDVRSLSVVEWQLHVIRESPETFVLSSRYSTDIIHLPFGMYWDLTVNET